MSEGWVNHKALQQMLAVVTATMKRILGLKGSASPFMIIHRAGAEGPAVEPLTQASHPQNQGETEGKGWKQRAAGAQEPRSLFKIAGRNWGEGLRGDGRQGDPGPERSLGAGGGRLPKAALLGIPAPAVLRQQQIGAETPRQQRGGRANPED